ncbi:MAG: hypothetical protein C0403_13625 [Desulfobacterium sp.]|nr:hypothetical protein [Desulfobacterium sp.]
MLFWRKTIHLPEPHIITCTIEHPAVLEVCNFLEQDGFRITRLPVDPEGLIRIPEIEKAIGSDTILITIMHANNEVGTIQPIAEIAGLAQKHQIPCKPNYPRIPVR